MELLLDDCRTLLKKFHKLIIQHIFREANQCVNTLAKFRVTLSFDYVYFVNPPTMMEDLLAFDKPEFFIIDLFVINLYQRWFTKKNKKMSCPHIRFTFHTHILLTPHKENVMSTYTLREIVLHTYTLSFIFLKEILCSQYFYNIFTTNFKWQVVITINDLLWKYYRHSPSLFIIC